MGVNITATSLLMLSLSGLPAQSTVASTQVDDLVQQLGAFPAAFPPSVQQDGILGSVEERRRTVYVQLRRLGNDALTALARGLSDRNVQVRRNVALFLSVAADVRSELSSPELDIQTALPSLVTAVGDVDPRVRQLAAQAIGEVGAPAVSAVPALVHLLTDSDVGSRNSACIALHGIGPAASDALPALRVALTDPDTDVRRFAQRAIERITAR